MSGTNTDGGEVDSNGTLQQGVVIRPDMDDKLAIELVSTLYGLKVKTIKELNSYDDRNYRITVEEEHTNPHIETLWPHGYTLKVLNSRDSPTPHVEAEHEILRILSEHGFACPVPVLNEVGRDYSREELSNFASLNGQEKKPDVPRPLHVVRLLQFVPGTMLTGVPCTPFLLHSAGKYAGALDKTIKPCRHPGITEHDTIWNLSQSLRLREVLHAVKDEKRRELIRDVLHHFEEDVLPNMKHFPVGAIHGDYNEQNILVEPIASNGEGSPDHVVCGILDFGDAFYSCYVFEAATAIMYMMTESRHVDSLDVGGYLLAGYMEEMPLGSVEWDALKILVACRFAQSLVMGAYTHSLVPDNEYLLVTAVRGWDILQRFWATPKAAIYKRWKEIIDSY